MTHCKTEEEKTKLLADLIADNPDNLPGPTEFKFKWETDYQRDILGALLRDVNLARKNRTRVKPMLFTGEANQVIWRLCADHLGKYDSLPSKAQLTEAIKYDLREKSEAVKLYHLGELCTLWEFHGGCEHGGFRHVHAEPINDSIEKFLDIQMIQVGCYKLCELIKKGICGEEASSLIQTVLLDQRRALRTQNTAGLRAFSPAEFMMQPKAKFLISHHLIEKSLALIYGPSGVGKSFFALEMAFCMGRGVPFLGKFATMKGKVLYLVSEAAGCFPARCEAYIKHYGLDPADVANVQLVPASFDFQKPDVAADVAAIQLPQNWKPDVVFVDTVFVNLRGDDNSPGDMNNFINGCHKIMDHFGCAVVGVHHEGKDKGRGARGHSSLFAACQSVIAIDGEANGRTFCVDSKKLTSGKPFHSYVLEKTIVELDPNDEDNPDSVVLSWFGSAKDEKAEAKAEAKAMKELEDDQAVVARIPFGGPDGKHETATSLVEKLGEGWNKNNISPVLKRLLAAERIKQQVGKRNEAHLYWREWTVTVTEA